MSDRTIGARIGVAAARVLLDTYGLPADPMAVLDEICSPYRGESPDFRTNDGICTDPWHALGQLMEAAFTPGRVWRTSLPVWRSEAAAEEWTWRERQRLVVEPFLKRFGFGASTAPDKGQNKA